MAAAQVAGYAGNEPTYVLGTSTMGSDVTLTSGDVWLVWNQLQTATTATSYATNTSVTMSTACNFDPWPVWNVTATSITTSGTWTVWNQARLGVAAGDGSEAIRARARLYAPRKKTEAEVQAELRQQKEYEERRLAQEAAALLAKERSERLLLGALSAEQREDLLKRHCFHLHVGEKKYRIKRGTHGNVELLDAKDQPIKRYCAQPGGVPVDDAVLAQKLALEADEAAFLRVANCTNLR